MLHVWRLQRHQRLRVARAREAGQPRTSRGEDASSPPPGPDRLESVRARPTSFGRHTDRLTATVTEIAGDSGASATATLFDGSECSRRRRLASPPATAPPSRSTPRSTRPAGTTCGSSSRMPRPRRGEPREQRDGTARRRPHVHLRRRGLDRPLGRDLVSVREVLRAGAVRSTPRRRWCSRSTSSTRAWPGSEAARPWYPPRKRRRMVNRRPELTARPDGRPVRWRRPLQQSASTATPSVSPQRSARSTRC